VSLGSQCRIGFVTEGRHQLTHGAVEYVFPFGVRRRLLDRPPELLGLRARDRRSEVLRDTEPLLGDGPRLHEREVRLRLVEAGLLLDHRQLGKTIGGSGWVIGPFFCDLV
jgi:hypothetical protein